MKWLWVRSGKIQTDTDTSSADEVELNSATEISTDSEFDHDELMRETPKIFIDDTHLRKPTKVQIKSTVLPPATGHTCNNFSHNNKAQIKIGSYLNNYQMKPPPVPQFKPLVQVDPSLLTTNRTPLKNPRIGDYLLNKTASTEGIASKKSLELKKRYLLGEPTNGSKIQKSGSTSILDSRIRSFQSNISECQKLLNPGNEISPGMKSFLDRTKLGEQIGGERMRSTTNDILNDLKVEITIQKTSSTASTDNEKENVFVNSKNVLNKGLEYAETVNTALMESLHKKALTTPPKNTPKLIETINLITPEKVDKTIEDSNRIIDLTCDTPEKDNCIGVIPSNQKNDCLLLNSVESVNKVSDRSCESPMKSDRTIIEDLKPDVSKDIKHSIPDILNHIELEEIQTERRVTCLENDENKTFLSNEEDNEEKADSPEKLENLDVCDVKIQVPNIPWTSLKTERMSSSTDSSCSSHSSSVEDIEHYILESTTSPETHNSTSQYHQVPRVEVHDSSGTLMQIDSLMIIDGKYIGDPEDLKYMEIPRNLIIPPPQPPPPAVQISTLENHTEADPEPLTTSPEPMENTIIDAPKKKNEHIYPTSDKPSKVKLSDLKFDTKNENKVESLKNLPLIVEQISEQDRLVKPRTLNLKSAPKLYVETGTRLTPEDIDADRTPTIELLSRGSDSETDPTGTGHILTETELSDWTADDCLSENFIDLEFVVNSNKDTVKRIRKGKKKHDTSKLTSSSEVLLEMTKTVPVAKFEGILKSIGIDDIEFMDTVSDIIEPQSHPTTNRVSPRYRGYIEAKTFTNNKNKNITSPLKGNLPGEWQQQIQIKRDEKLGIDYIEQGAYIMQDDLNKTPVNETAGLAPAGDGVNVKTLQSSQMTQSLTDTSTLNDIEEDSTCALTLQLSSATGTGTGSSLAASATTITTNKNSVSQPESEALTIVTSPLDSSSLKIHVGDVISEEAASSSSERIPKTSLSTESTFNSPSSKVTPPSSPEDNNNEVIGVSTNYRKSTEEISYEDYVRALQQKITQISAARGDSLDSRKQRRKSSKSEVPNSQTSPNSTTATSTWKITQSVIETNCINAAAPATTTTTYSVTDNRDLKTFDAQNAGTAVNSSSSCKVPEIPTLTRRLEEITKERTKQKDLIHDLVMDKLQSKKQLNAEKRLNRSRQRSLLTSPNARSHGNGGTSQSPSSHTPIESTTIAGGTCTNNKAHYHLSTAVTKQPEQRLFKSSSFKEDKSSSTYTSPYSSEAATPTTAGTTRFSKQRPCSENFKVDATNPLMTLLTQKPTTPNVTKPGCREIRAVNCFTPVPPLRQNRGRQASIPGASQSANFGESAYSISTENLRSEARARARLKTNTELGLSPEEKMLLLRKRLQADYPKNNTKDFPIKVSSGLGNASKSVNDLTYYTNNNNNVNSNQNQNSHLQHSENTIKKDDKAKGDFLSDPNLLSLSPTKTKTGRRVKNPERRKSLIQSLTNFFHKNAGSTQQQRENNHNHDECSVNPVTAENNFAVSERPSTGGSSNSTTTTTSTSHTISSSIDGMLSRFRISPRSKEKSKDKMRPLNSYTSASAQCLQIIGKLSGSTVGHNDYRSSTPHSLHTSSSSNCKCTHKINSNTQLHNSQSSQQPQPQHQHQSIKKQELESEPRGNLHAKLLQKRSASSSALAFSSSSSPPISVNKSRSMTNATIAHCNDQTPPPIPPLPLNYQRSDDESNTTENREQKRQQRAMSKATRQAELKRLRIAQEIQREQEEIEVQLKELEGRGVLIEKALRGEAQNYDNPDISSNVGGSDEMLLKELLEIWRNITHLKQRDEELSIRQTELQLEYRHAQLKEELNLRLSTNKLEKSSADVAAEGAILNEMLEIVAKRAALRPSISSGDIIASSNVIHTPDAPTVSQILLNSPLEQTHHTNETNV